MLLYSMFISSTPIISFYGCCECAPGERTEGAYDLILLVSLNEGA